MHESEVNPQGFTKAAIIAACIGALYTLAIMLIDRAEYKRLNVETIERIAHDCHR